MDYGFNTWTDWQLAEYADIWTGDWHSNNRAGMEYHEQSNICPPKGRVIGYLIYIDLDSVCSLPSARCALWYYLHLSRNSVRKRVKHDKLSEFLTFRQLMILKLWIGGWDGASHDRPLMILALPKDFAEANRSRIVTVDYLSTYIHEPYEQLCNGRRTLPFITTGRNK